MNNSVVGAIAFALGAAAGSIATWLLVKKKYEKQAQDDIQEIRDYYAEKYKDKKPVELEYEHTGEPIAKVDILEETANGVKAQLSGIKNPEQLHWFDEGTKIDYANIVRNEGYTNEEKGVGTAPYVIAPEEYGEADGYEMISLTSYADGVLADDWDEPVEDIANTVGADYASHFGEYEDDSVFVRNERLKVDYEILADPRRFEDVANAGPSLDHDE